MKTVAIFLLLVGLAISAPTTNETKDSDKLIIDQDFFVDNFKVHTAQHDIVSILVPLNALNFGSDDDDDDEGSDETTLFFVEADVTGDKNDYKGLSVLKDKKAKLILPTGTDAAAANDDTKTAYFAATDGIYSYNEKDMTAVKYGTITDSIISIAKVNGSDVIYILTDKNELYKVTEEGTKKEKVNEVVGAQQIVLDYSNNLYYYNVEKQPHVYTEEGVKKIEGLPANPTYMNLLKPPFIIDDGVPVVIDNKSYVVYVNGSSELTDFEFTVRPTAYAMEATLVQYVAYDKKIYEYNILSIIMGTLLDEIKSFLDDKVDQIQEIATRSRNDLKA